MRYSLPSKSKASATSKSTSTSSAAAAQSPSGLTPTAPSAQKRRRVEEPQVIVVEETPEGSRRQDRGKGHLEPQQEPEGPILIPESRVLDTEFQVTGVSDHFINQALRLPPRFSLPFQAIYTYFHESQWSRFKGMDIMERQRASIVRQISSLELSLLNYIELEALLSKDSENKAAEEELQNLRTARIGLEESLEVEKAKVRSLEEGIVKLQKDLEAMQRTKEESYKLGYSVGGAHAVEKYLSSEDFLQRKREAVEEYTSSTAFEHQVSARLEAYKASAEFEDLQLSLMEAAGNQILDRFKKRRPDVDLSFLDESDEENEELAGAEPSAGTEGVGPDEAADGGEK